MGFFSGDYMPHGHCYLWRPSILWTHVISDLLIAAAYFSIPVALFLFVKQRKDLQFKGTILLFACFILFCGITHIVAIFTIWHGVYGLHGLTKAATAVVSVITAYVTYKSLPKAIALPSPKDIEEAHKQIALEQSARTQLLKEKKDQALFEYVTELLPTGLLVVDSKRIIKVANQAIAKIFDYPREQLIGANIEQLLGHGEDSHIDMLFAPPTIFADEKTAPDSERIMIGHTRSGHSIPLEVLVSRHSYEGEDLAFASVVGVSQGDEYSNALYFENSNRLRRAINASSDGIWEWNPTTNDVWYSDRLMQLLGHDPHTIQSDVSLWKNHIHPSDLRMMEEALENHLKFNLPFDVIYRGETAPKVYEWLHVRGNTLRDSKDQPLLMSGTLSNINELKTLERELSEKTRFLEAILGKSLAGLYIFDLLLNENIFVNQEYTALTGYTLEDLQEIQQQGTLLQLFHPDELQAFIEHIEQVKTSPSNRGLPFEYRFRHKDGHWMWCYARNSIYDFDDHQAPTQMIGTFFDITRLKSREKRIKDLAQEYTDSFEQAAVGIAHIDIQGNWIKANAKLCEMLAYTHAELVQLSIKDLSFPEDMEADNAAMRQLIAGELKTYERERRYICADSAMLWAKLTASLVRNSEAEPLYFIAVIEDISARKQMEVALEESNRSLERFAYSASHDLQEPLRKISSFADSLLRRLDNANLDTDSKFELERMSNAAQRMRDMIDSLLQLSRFSRQHFVKTAVQASEIMAVLRDDLSEMIGETHAEIILQNDAILYADKAGLQAVFENIVTNSMKYRRADVPPSITIDITELKAEMQIKISDNGEGFDPRYREAIYTPFKRLVGGKTRGSGMGLAICRQIVIAHGGRIEADSAPGHGTTFFIYLPKGSERL